jgi:cellulose synthase/poly-beta-1,6-N-acetylglucosamine synthase-like glycosyltransferase
MEITILLRFLVFFGFGAPLVIFGLYGILLLIYGKSDKNYPEKSLAYDETDTFEPSVSVVIPTHNEESIIAKRIENLLASNYPLEKLEIIFVDDSNDSTPMIIEDYSKRYPCIRLIRFSKRMGYSPSLIAGCEAAKGEIVVLAEASSFLEPDTIERLVSNFRDPSIGTVSGKDILLNLNEEIGQSEGMYLKILDFVRKAESNMDSTIYMKGEAAAVRKDLIKDLEELDGCPGTADTAIALFVRSKGYRFIFDPQAKFHEYAPSTRSGRVRQKVIRGANLIKILWRFRGMFFNRKYGKFGMVVLPFNLAMLAFVPISLLAGVLSLIVLTFFEPMFSLTIWIAIGSLLLFGTLYSKQIVMTVLEFEYSLLKALYEVVVVRKAHDKIDKVASTRRTS